MSSIKIKPLTLAVGLLGLSLPAFADGGICIPSTKGGFNAGIDALYLRANIDNLAYGIVTSDPDTSNNGGSFDHTNEIIDPTYDWGFRVQIGYWFPCSRYDISLAYSRLNTVDSDSVIAPTNQQPNSVIIIAPLSDPQFINGGSYFSAANSKVNFDLNVIDLDTGRHVSSNNYDVRLFAGLRYANIDRDIYTTAEPFADNDEDVISANQQFKSHFEGIGPRIGAQGRYGQCCGWGLDADINMAILIGQLDSRYQGNMFLNDERSRHWTTHEAKNCATPALEAKLGFDYTSRLGCKRDAVLVLEAGYQASSYLDAINTPSMNNAYDGEYTSTTSGTTNVTFNGPYLGVKYYA